MVNDLTTLKNVFASVIEDFFTKDSYFFMSESDLLCTVYGRLMELRKYYDWTEVKIKNQRTKGKVHGIYTEVNVADKDCNDRKCDLVILDKDEVEIVKENKDSEWGLTDDSIKKSIFVEFKWGWGKQMDTIVGEINADCNKLNNNVKHAYKIVFYMHLADKLAKLERCDIKEVKVIYVARDEDTNECMLEILSGENDEHIQLNDNETNKKTVRDKLNSFIG